jgi:hypothetical protein
MVNYEAQIQIVAEICELTRLGFAARAAQMAQVLVLGALPLLARASSIDPSARLIHALARRALDLPLTALPFP